MTLKHTAIFFFSTAAEHMAISNLTGKLLKSVKESAESYHLLECNCLIDYSVTVLAFDVNKFGLLIKQKLLIKQDQR